MKLHYIQPRMEVIEMASCENLLQMSEDLGQLNGAEDGTGDDVGTTEKFLNPIWGGDPSADESDALSPW